MLNVLVGTALARGVCRALRELRVAVWSQIVPATRHAKQQRGSFCVQLFSLRARPLLVRADMRVRAVVR
jgi:hypothetical protein